MAATYHTTHLGLSLWAQTDCPQWADFLQDNQKLDQQVGGHIQDSALHLTAEEKQYLSQRSASVTYTGTGSSTQSVTLPFLPRKLTVLAQGKPPMAPRSDGGWDVYMETWVAGEEAAASGTGGITVAADTLAARFAEGAFSGESSVYHALNRSGVTYVAVLEA